MHYSVRVKEYKIENFTSATFKAIYLLDIDGLKHFNEVHRFLKGEQAHEFFSISEFAGLDTLLGGLKVEIVGDESLLSSSTGSFVDPEIYEKEKKVNAANAWYNNLDAEAKEFVETLIEDRGYHAPWG